MASWKKIVVNGADNVYLTGSFSGSSFHGDGSNLTGVTIDSLSNALEDGNGIVGFTYDGSDTATVTVQADESTITVEAGGIKVADGGIDTTQLADDAVTSDKLADNIDIAGTLDVTLAATFDNNVTVAGDLTVQGTTTQLQVANLNVEDQFILLNSSSTDPVSDGGIIIQTDDSANGTALFYDNSSNRWAIAESSSVAWNAATATAHQYVVSVSQSGAAPTGDPSNFGINDATRYGMMYVDTSDTSGDGGLYIYLP